MITTELLLERNPEDAIVIMVNAENNTRFPSGVFEISAPVALEGRSTRVTLTARESSHKQDIVPYTGSFDFVYQRLRLEDHFKDVLTGYTVSLPTSTQVVLDELTRRLGQDFFTDDIVLEEIGRNNAAPYRLKAKAESLRWIGELEITLSEPTDLETFFSRSVLSNSGPRMGHLNDAPQLRDPAAVYAFLNATPWKNLVDDIVIGNYAQDQASLRALLNAAVPTPGENLNTVSSPWTLSTTPSEFNGFNARSWEPKKILSDVNAINPQLNRAVQVELDLTRCTGFDTNVLQIPYREDDFSAANFSSEPRLTRYGVKSLTDGTAYGTFLNTLVPGTVLQHLGTHVNGMILVAGDPPYTCNDVPGLRNLKGATVIYNGQRRIQDSKPANTDLDRVLVLALSPLNTAYRGNFAIHYRASIVLLNQLPSPHLNSVYSQSLYVSGGVGTVTYAVASGTLAPGQSLSTSGVLSGAASATGTYKFTVEATDSANNKVRYSYTYAVITGPLALTGNAPDGLFETTYNFAYAITGGRGPYSVIVEEGSLPTGWSIDNTGRILGTAPNTAAGTWTWTLLITDTLNVSIQYTDTVVISDPENAP